MPLVEDVKDAKLQFVSWIVLFISTVLIQVADFYINEFQNSLNQEILEASNQMQLHTIETIDTAIGMFKGMLPLDKLTEEERNAFIEDNIKKDKETFLLDKELSNVNLQLKKGEITLKEYFNKKATIHDKKSREHLKIYNKKTLKINKQLKEGSNWNAIKKFIFFPLQILCVLYLGFEYLKSMKNILKKK